jgi:hypothetical protein
MKRIALSGLLGVAAVAWGWQEGLSKLGLDPGMFEARVRSAVYEATGRPVGQMQAPSMGKAAAEAGRAMSDGAGAALQADKKKQEQQVNYNKYSLKPVMKARLTEFVALARTVDFTAQTQPKDGRQVFVRPAHERQTAMWKFLYRLGPGGTKEAMAIAQAWAAEL